MPHQIEEQMTDAGKADPFSRDARVFPTPQQRYLADRRRNRRRGSRHVPGCRRGEMVIRYDDESPELVALMDEIYALVWKRHVAIEVTWDGYFETHRIHLRD